MLYNKADLMDLSHGACGTWNIDFEVNMAKSRVNIECTHVYLTGPTGGAW